ncbi:tctex1 domain-containing protein 1-B [Exaiptasia diaphana]|uniref:Uncharacterized protein n=1 Tax=Exaiptasia diaphana TaxID=2652724 RepID=A0A913YBN4_EXADI|nr:tctex1 domain-containing protein 1-B [Exaiptasia diaphana]KXJ19285.1 Tctex1 domain-containing protein 1-B [Exaiptasia diaphana]
MSLQPPSSKMLSSRRGTLRNSLAFHQSKRVSLAPPQSESDGTSMACFDKKDLMLANTYKMSPDQKFLPGKVKAYMENLLENTLKDLEYDDEKAKGLCLSLSEEIKGKVKENWLVNRFKLVCVVNVGKPFNQGLQITSRCLWNSAFDTFVTASFSTEKIFGMATVYAIYLE